MRSRKVIVGEERQEDFDRLAAGWRAEYEPEGQAGESLIGRLILADWLLQRAEGNYLEAEAELESRTTGTQRPVRSSEAEADPLEWSEEQHRKLELYLRYKTTAERSFYRAFYAVRGLRKDKTREELDVEKFRGELRRAAREEVVRASAEHQREKAEAEVREAEKAAEVAAAKREKEMKASQKRQTKKAGAPVVLEQWVEVEIQDGRTVTKLYPTNEQMRKLGEAMEPAPDLVYRRMNFPQGIPAEYRWTARSHFERGQRAANALEAEKSSELFERGGAGVQRMTVETWLRVIEREAASGTGHVGPTGVGNLPRPKERGGCDCAVCTFNREVMERRAG